MSTMGILDMIKNLLGMGGGASTSDDAADQRSPSAKPAPAPAEASSDEDEDDGDASERRDYDREARDDFASFKPQTLDGYKRWFVANFRIERAWEEPSERAKLFAEYGIQDPQHFHQVRATMERYMGSADARQRHGDTGNIMQIQANAQQEFMIGGMQAQTKAGGALAGEVQPVEGVSLEQWAAMQASIAGGKPLEAMLSAFNLDQAQWTRVSAEWNARMSRDQTATIAMVYGNAFSAASQGKYAQYAKEGSECLAQGRDPQLQPPISLEQYFEILEAQSAAFHRGQDVTATLKQFGLSIMDWSDLGAWFSAYINRNANKNNQAMLRQINEIQARMKAKYAS
jgi:hypothetical protein